MTVYLYDAMVEAHVRVSGSRVEPEKMRVEVEEVLRRAFAGRADVVQVGARVTSSSSTNVKQRLEELRVELRAERISYGELAELQSLADLIEPGDVELLEAAGVPEFLDEPRYKATFSPQAWVNDNAVPVDPPGPTEWDATEFVTRDLSRYGRERYQTWLADTLEHGDREDVLRTDPNAPEWVREWSGPFETYLEVEA